MGRAGLMLAAGLLLGAFGGYWFARRSLAGSSLSLSSPPPPKVVPLSLPGKLPDPFQRVIQVVKAAEKGVVHVATTAPIPEEYRLFREFFFGERLPERVPANYGSGFFFRPDGYVLTNFHVVEGADTIRVGIDEETELPAMLVGYDPLLDIAVLKVTAPLQTFPALPFGDSDRLEKGEPVIAIGNPFGLDKTVTLGVISAKGREFTLIKGRPSVTSYIQTDAAINPGNSGGPLLNLRGEVIGINTFILGRRGNIGIGFAIPINEVKGILDRLLRGGRVTRGYLGVDLVDANSPKAQGLGVSAPSGALIIRMRIDAPAYRAGLRPGDIIIKFNGIPVKDATHLRRLVLRQPGGAKVTMEVLRKGRHHTFEVTLGSL